MSQIKTSGISRTPTTACIWKDLPCWLEAKDNLIG